MVSIKSCGMNVQDSEKWLESLTCQALAPSIFLIMIQLSAALQSSDGISPQKPDIIKVKYFTLKAPFKIVAEGVSA